MTNTIEISRLSEAVFRARAGMIAALCALAVAAPASAQDSYPDRVVTLVLPFAAGAAADIGARLIAHGLGEKLGQQFIVENRTGASGNIAYASVARADPDGYEVLISYVGNTACGHALKPDLNWKAEDLVPVAMYSAQPLAVVVHKDVPASTMPEFIDYLKAHPGELNFGTPGNGSLAHIATELLMHRTDTRMVHIPYTGTGALMPDALSGTIQFIVGGPSGILAHQASGALRALAVTGQVRAQEMPDIPTLQELELPDVPLESWYGLAVPKGTPPEVIAKLETALGELAQDAAFIESAETASVPITYLNREDFAARIVADTKVCAEAIEAAGIQLP